MTLNPPRERRYRLIREVGIGRAFHPHFRASNLMAVQSFDTGKRMIYDPAKREIREG